MDVQEWLKGWKAKNIEIDSVKAGILYLERHSTSSVNCRIQELRERLDRMMEEKAVLLNIIDGISDPVARSLFRYRYVIGYKWGVVAKKCGNMSERAAHYLHERALPEVEALYKKFVLDQKGADYARN